MVGQTLNNQNLRILMTVLSIAFGGGIALIGVLEFVFWSISNPIDFMLAIYFVLFGIMAAVCEFPIPKLGTYFSFLKKYLGKGLYFVL
jgi:COPI associated protein